MDDTSRSWFGREILGARSFMKIEFLAELFEEVLLFRH